jgi:hypothetical protein
LDVYYYFVFKAHQKIKFSNLNNHGVEEPFKIYLAQAPFTDKRKKKHNNNL